MIAAPANVPYIKSFILIFPYSVAESANEVTTEAEMAQYALIIPLLARKGGVLIVVVGVTLGTSSMIQG